MTEDAGWSDKPVYVEPDSTLSRVGNLVARWEGIGLWRIISADPHVLITVEQCDRMVDEPNSHARMEILNNCDADCEDAHTCANKPSRVFLAHFADDFGNAYVYVLGQYHNLNGVQCFEASWPD